MTNLKLDDNGTQTKTPDMPMTPSPYDGLSSRPQSIVPSLEVPSSEMQPLSTLTGSQQSTLISYNHLTYLLYVVSYFTAGLLWIVPIAMNYLKRREADGSWLATHFDWQIKTFWYSIVFFVVGTMMVIFSLGGLGISIFADNGHAMAGSLGLLITGFMLIGVTFLWHLYRIIRGWIALADKRPVP